MDLYSVNTAQSAIVQQSYTKTGKTAEKETYSKKTSSFSDEAAVYEKSQDTDKSGKVNGKNARVDHSAIVAQMKADLETRQNQLLDIVRNTMTQQGRKIGQADDMWKFLAGGDFTVDAATREQAQKDIAEDGYWGVDKTSDRILDFAKALSGNDPEKADKLLEAFKEGFRQATKAWGKRLPDISSRTYDAVVKKFDAWKNGREETGKAE